jgi:hypothetical protein
MFALPNTPITGQFISRIGELLCGLGPRRFDEPILLPDDRKLRTLREAINWLAREISKSEHKMEKVQNAAHCVTRAAEHGGPMIFAQMGMMQAIHRHHKRVFNPDRKDPHWGRRKLKRDTDGGLSSLYSSSSS